MTRAFVLLRLVSAMGFVLLGTVCATAEESWTARIVGRYSGQLRGGPQPLPITTTLRSTPNQTVAGEYLFVEPGGTRVDGTLEGCVAVRALTLMCRWRDRHSEGTLELIFAADTRSFAGRWSSTIKPNDWYPWSGTRSAAPGN